MKKIFTLLAVMIALCGCVNIQYTGVTAEPYPDDAPPVAVFYDAARITRPYKVLGTATATANYREAGSDRMIDALKKKAKESGANAILITSHQVTAQWQEPVGSPSFTTAWDFDEMESNWRIINQDVDQGFVNNMRYSGSHTTSGSSNNFTRTIKAEFLRY